MLACAENKPLGLTAGGLVKLGGQAIVGSEEGVIRINYAGPPGTFETISFAKVVNGEAPKGGFRDRIVLIGAETKDKPDLIHTPFTTPFTIPGGMYGVEVHANAINTLASGGVIRSMAGWQSLVLVFLVSAIAIMLLTTLRPMVGLSAALGLGVVFFGASVLLFSWSRLLVRMVEPLLAVFICCVGALLYRYLLEEREKRSIRNLFSRFVAPSVVEQILREGAGVKLGGEIRTVTVFFSDIRGFTTMSEKMAPERVVLMLNEYFREMVEIIFQFGGTLNKFIGDAIMAIYGAPLPMPDAEEKAVRACLRMRETLARLNADRTARDQEPIHIGMALHRGEVLLGNIGSPRQMEYTVIGDVVNICSRLQNLTKKLQTDFLVSDDVYQAVSGLIDAEWPRLMKVKGKSVLVQVHKVLGLKEV